MKHLKQTAAVLLCILTLLPLGACRSGSTALTASGQTISSGLYNWYLVQAYNAACELNGGKEGLFTAQLEEKDASAWIQDKAVELCKEHLAIEQKFDERGLSVGDDGDELVETTVSQYWKAAGYSRNYETLGVDEESFRAASLNDYKRDQIFADMKAELVAELTDDQQREYYQSHYALIKFIAIPYDSAESGEDAGNPEMEDAGNPETEDTGYKAAFDGYLSRLKGGADFDTIIDELLLEDELIMAGASTSKTSETGSVKFRSQDAYASLVARGQSGYPAAFLDGLFDKEYGKLYTYDDSGNLFNIAYERLDLNGDTVAFDSCRDDLQTRMARERFEEQIAEWASQITVEENTGVTKQNVEEKFS
ncbi:hypothetical protein [Candidatus Soleaferrea massiliensis]|uniref:hypothetical protein n=1 Tax=Candidatus Soleaferrea massiliensis TaxID=1470354 RepID=UPI00058CA7F4|nr:hypothetical protein [Candidatus Soleaferrea massiliensis]